MVLNSEFKTFWLVGGAKVTNYQTMQRRVMAGETAIEVSGERQQAAAEERKSIAKANAIKDAEISKAAAERAHERSPEGLQQAARLTALQNPGGIVSGGMNPMAELDQYSPASTNLLR